MIIVIHIRNSNSWRVLPFYAEAASLVSLFTSGETLNNSLLSYLHRSSSMIERGMAQRSRAAVIVFALCSLLVHGTVG